ncbi:MAG: hypothetical protein AB1762_22345 [Gemmatimonadota bacterium]
MIKLAGRAPNEPRRKRVIPAAVVSIGLHIVLLIALWFALELPNPLAAFRPNEERREERLTYVGVRPTRPAPTASRRAVPTQTTERPAVEPPAQVPLPVPREIPTGVPAAPRRDSIDLGPTSGPVVGGRGIARGVQPAYVDPRVWVPAPALEPANKTDDQRMDSAVVATLKRHNDSLASNRYQPNKFERGDWTVDGPGGKWGIDPPGGQQFIHLGKFKIPAALLALIPVNGAPSAASRELQNNMALATHRAEIPMQAQRAITHEEFRRAVKQLRERKEREKRERENTVAKKPIAPSSP